MTATGVAEVDPRFEARRAAVERDGRRRRRLQLVLVVAAVVDAAGMVGAVKAKAAESIRTRPRDVFDISDLHPW